MLENKVIIHYLRKLLSEGQLVRIEVVGNSMFPLLEFGDNIDVQRKSEYKNGDVIVFLFEEQKLIVHRLLFKYNGYFYCKGDNSFRLEMVNPDAVLGCVKRIIRKDVEIDIPTVSKDFIKQSLKLNLAYQECGYNKEVLMRSEIYELYAKTYLEK